MKGILSIIVRAFGLIKVADQLRYRYYSLKNSAKNKAFVQKNPSVVLPPDYLMYESFRLDYQKYYEGGLATAIWLQDLVSPYLDLKGKTILDWGCGPGRIIRHWGSLLGASTKIHGTDYNGATIEWCKAKIYNVEFNKNNSDASLSYKDDMFDFIYGISILTHLSELKHKEWIRELSRITKPEGIILLTTQGDNFKSLLTKKELNAYETGELIVRSRTEEGHRTYSAFQPKSYMETLLVNFKILKHHITDVEASKATPQDVWIIQKNKNVSYTN